MASVTFNLTDAEIAALGAVYTGAAAAVALTGMAQERADEVVRQRVGRESRESTAVLHRYILATPEVQAQVRTLLGMA